MDQGGSGCILRMNQDGSGRVAGGDGGGDGGGAADADAGDDDEEHRNIIGILVAAKGMWKGQRFKDRLSRIVYQLKDRLES